MQHSVDVHWKKIPCTIWDHSHPCLVFCLHLKTYKVFQKSRHCHPKYILTLQITIINFLPDTCRLLVRALKPEVWLVSRTASALLSFLFFARNKGLIHKFQGQMHLNWPLAPQTVKFLPETKCSKCCFKLIKTFLFDKVETFQFYKVESICPFIS